VEAFDPASTQDDFPLLYWFTPCSLCLTVEGSLISTVLLPCCTDLFPCEFLITEPLRSSECFLATIATVVLEVRCCYSGRTIGRWSCRGPR
jgi:hypothetical protein